MFEADSITVPFYGGTKREMTVIERVRTKGHARANVQPAPPPHGSEALSSLTSIGFVISSTYSNLEKSGERWLFQIFRVAEIFLLFRDLGASLASVSACAPSKSPRLHDSQCGTLRVSLLLLPPPYELSEAAMENMAS